jgi:hypothetical protein
LAKRSLLPAMITLCHAHVILSIPIHLSGRNIPHVPWTINPSLRILEVE